MGLVLVTLAIGGFGIGVTEFVSMGILPLITESFGIVEGKGSYIISAYALGVMIGAPAIGATSGTIPRRRLLLILMGAFVVGHVLSMLAPNYPSLVAARFVAGLPHGAYFSVAGLSAASLAGPGNRGKAIAVTGLGFSIATLAGVPAAQALGQWFGWQAAYVFVTVVGLLTILGLWFFMPHMVSMKATGVRTELGALANKQVWLTILIGTIGFGGMFAVYTYIGWTMEEVAGVPGTWLWLVLMIYGGGSLLGNLVGGYLADRSPELGIAVTLSSIAVALGLFWALSSYAIPAIVFFGIVGLFGSALVPNLQVRFMDVAGDAQTLAASLNHSALNLANASGAALAGAVINAGFGYSAPALVGTFLAVAGLVVWMPAAAMRKREASSAARVS